MDYLDKYIKEYNLMKKKFSRYFILFLIFWHIFFLLNLTVFSENREIIWQKTYGGIKADNSAEIIYSRENYLLVVGETNSWGAGNSDAWIIKLDQEGNIIWDRTYGDKANDGAYSIVETEDNGYLICGYTWSKDRKDDGWIFKIDRNGKMIWEQTYGDITSDRLTSVIRSKDQGYITVGFADRDSCPLCREQGYVWIINLNEEGQKIWERKFGGSTYDMANQVIQSPEAYILVGRAKLKSSETYSAWLLKVDDRGNILDDLMITNNKDNYFKSIIATKEVGNFIILGDTWFESSGNSDLWLLKIR